MRNLADRNTGIESLRIIAMLMIVTIHFFSFGNVNPTEGTVNYFFSNFFLGISQCGVNIFFIISGYFLIKSKFNLSRAVKVWLETVFYSLLWCIVIFLKNKTFSLSFLSALFPFTSNSYWFVTNYLLILFLIPFLNRVVLSFDKTKASAGMLILFVAFSLIPSFIPSSSVIPYLSFGGGYDIVWSIICYLTGAYIRIYPPKICKLIQFAGFAVSAFLIPLSVSFLDLMKNSHNLIANVIYTYIFKENPTVMIQYSSVFVYIASILIFLVFKDAKFKNSKFNKTINYISSLTFAVYLLHNNDLIIGDLWETLDPAENENNSFLFIYMLICVLGIFILCCLIEMLRSVLFNFLHKKIKLDARCQSAQERFINAFDNTIKGVKS